MNGKEFLNNFCSSELINTSETVSILVDLRKKSRNNNTNLVDVQIIF